VLTFAGGYYRSLSKKHTEKKLMTAGVGLMMFGLFGLASVAYAAAHPEPPSLKFGFYASMAVAVIGFAFVNPSVSALVSKKADPDRQGEVLGVNQAFASLGRILGPFLGSVLFFADASRTLPYFCAVGLLLLVVLLLPRVKSV
jgi:MFS family permease